MKMFIKDFFHPTNQKVVFAIILSILTAVWLIMVAIPSKGYSFVVNIAGYVIAPYLDLIGYFSQGEVWGIVAVFVVMIIYSYLISCIVIYLASLKKRSHFIP